MSESIRLPDPEPPPRPSAVYRSLKDGDLANPLSLGEFFGGLGGLMRFSPKRRKGPEQPTPPKRATRFVIPAVAVISAVLFSATKPGQTKAPEPLPAGLTGRWMTIATNYSDRAMEFLPGRVVFVAGPRQEDRTEHAITRVLSRQVGDTTVITLSYLDAGSSYDLALKYASVPELGVRFINQEHLVWRPEGQLKR